MSTSFSVTCEHQRSPASRRSIIRERARAFHGARSALSRAAGAEEVIPALDGGTIEVSTLEFLRGDANADGAIDIGDAVCVLGYLFGSADDPCKGRVGDCLDAADGNDDGLVDIADPIKILEYLFAHGGPLPDPFGACGRDGTIDPSGCCRSFPPCRQADGGR